MAVWADQISFYENSPRLPKPLKDPKQAPVFQAAVPSLRALRAKVVILGACTAQTVRGGYGCWRAIRKSRLGQLRSVAPAAYSPKLGSAACTAEEEIRKLPFGEISWPMYGKDSIAEVVG